MVEISAEPVRFVRNQIPCREKGGLLSRSVPAFSSKGLTSRGLSGPAISCVSFYYSQEGLYVNPFLGLGLRDLKPASSHHRISCAPSYEMLLSHTVTGKAILLKLDLA
jgi:hypothetical protein